MRKPAPFGHMPDLHMPLRDAVRGVSRLADATEEALEPAARLLPEPIRSRLRKAMISLESAGRRLVSSPVTSGSIKDAAAFLSGDSVDTAARDACAAVFCYAWDHLHESGLKHNHLISETVLADVFSHLDAAAEQGGSQRAALIVSRILRSSAIGPMPGLAGVSSEADKAEELVALSAIAVWLLTDRADGVSEEEKLLDLSLALTVAVRDELLQAKDDAVAVAQLLESAAVHL